MPVRVYTFQCQVCSKLFRTSEPGEPCCTGPSETRDDHELTVMYLLQIDDVEVDPARAAERAEGPLIIPTEEDREREKVRPLIILP